MAKNDKNTSAAPQADKANETEEQVKKESPKKAENKKIQELEKELASAKETIAKEKDGYMRLLAEFDTFRRRTAEEKLKITESACADVVKGMLPVLDSCEQALKMLENSENAADKEGIELIYSNMMSYLKTKGLEIIKSQGEKFDTDFHEAVAQMPVQDEAQKGIIYDVVQTGYMLSGKVLRYAKVVVGI